MRTRRVMLGAAAMAATVAAGSAVVAVAHGDRSSRPKWVPSAPAAVRPANAPRVAAVPGGASPVLVFVRQPGPGLRYQSTVWVTRRPITLTPMQVNIVNARTNGGQGAVEQQRYFDLLASFDPVSPGETEVDIGFENTSKTPVQIENVRPFAITRSAPLDGTLWCDPTGERFGDPLPRILFDLDEAHPVGRKYTTAPLWPATRTLKPGELADVHVLATTDHSDVRFRLAFDVVAGRRRTTVKLDDNGRPFEVTAWLDVYAGRWPIHTSRHYHNGYYVEAFRDADHNPGYVKAVNPAAWKIPDHFPEGGGDVCM